MLEDSRKCSAVETTTTSDSKQNSLELSVTRERDLRRATECRDVGKFFERSSLLFPDEQEGSSEYTRLNGSVGPRVMLYFKPKQDGKVRKEKR